MPSLELSTNVKLDDPRAFCVEFSKLSAEILGKPESYICVTYTYKEYMTWEGTFDPAYLLIINSLGNVNPEANIIYSQKFSEYLQEKIGAPNNRGYIAIIDPGNDNLGHRGTTFGVIFGKH